MSEQMTRMKGLQSNPAHERLLLTIVPLFWFAQYIFIPYQTPYLTSLGVSPSLIGIVVGSYGFAQLILRLPVGLLADRRGRHKPFILLGVASAGIASLFRILFPGELGFLIGNLLSGLASAMWISFMVLFFTYFPKDKLGKASGLIVGANNFGILMGFVAGMLLYEPYGMTLLCILSAASAVPTFLLSTGIKEQHDGHDALPVRELVRVYADKRLIIFALLALIQQGIQLSTAMSFTTQVAHARGANGVQIGVCSIIYMVTAVLSSYFSGTGFARRLGVSFWIPAIFVGLAAYCLLIPNLPSVEWIYVAQILSGLATGILFSSCTAEAMKNIPKEKSSTAMGFYQAVYAVGMTTFPILTGAITDAFDIRTAFYALAGTAVVGLAGALAFYWNARRVSI